MRLSYEPGMADLRNLFHLGKGDDRLAAIAQDILDKEEPFLRCRVVGEGKAKVAVYRLHERLADHLRLLRAEAGPDAFDPERPLRLDIHLLSPREGADGDVEWVETVHIPP